MDRNILSRREAIAAGLVVAATVGGTAAAAQGGRRLTSQEEKNLQMVMAWFQKFSGKSPDVAGIVDKFTDDVYIRIGNESETEAVGKAAAANLIKGSTFGNDRRWMINFPPTTSLRSFVSGPMVIVEFNGAGFKNGEAPPAVPTDPVGDNHWVGMFLVKKGKIAMWIDTNRYENPKYAHLL